MNTADEQRFFAKTKLADVPRPGMETPCLEWTASLTRGYRPQPLAAAHLDEQKRTPRPGWLAGKNCFLHHSHAMVLRATASACLWTAQFCRAAMLPSLAGRHSVEQYICPRVFPRVLRNGREQVGQIIGGFMHCWL